jgi:hypothetical protein
MKIIISPPSTQVQHLWPLAISLKKTPLEKNKPLKNVYKFSKCPNQMNMKFEPQLINFMSNNGDHGGGNSTSKH